MAEQPSEVPDEVPSEVPDEVPTVKIGVVRYEGVEYPLITQMSEREKFEAERIVGRTINDIGHYTIGLLLAFFTLKRRPAYNKLDWNNWLDAEDFTFEEVESPLAQPGENVNDGLNPVSTIENDGPQSSPGLTASTPG